MYKCEHSIWPSIKPWGTPNIEGWKLEKGNRKECSKSWEESPFHLKMEQRGCFRSSCSNVGSDFARAVLVKGGGA